MKIVVFGSIYWETKEQADKLKRNLNEWQNRVLKYIPSVSNLFLTSGTYSNSEYNPTNLQLYQYEIYNKQKHTDEWNYWRVSFLNGLYYSALTYKPDLLIFCQTNVFLKEDITNKIQEFLKSDFKIMAPRINSFWGHGIETGFMILKPYAISKYMYSGLRQCLDPNPCLCVEKEALELFRKEWFNPWGHINSFRKKINESDIRITEQNKTNLQRCYNLSDSVFLSLPLVIGVPHCSEQDIEYWFNQNSIK